MKNTLFIWICLLFLAGEIHAQQQPQAYRLFNAKGKKISYRKMLRKLRKSDVIFFGEFHNNPMSHWLQLEVTRALGEKRNLVLGAEMFERDNEDALQRYLKGEIDQAGLDSLARLWKNFKTDYKPLVDYARANRIPFVSTNIPRRYASMVYRQGFEALEKLPEKEKSRIAPLPIPYDAHLPGYVKMLDMMGGSHGAENFPKAQAIKDATMGYFIAQNMQEGSLFIHYNGTYHSDNHGDQRGEGIIWYLKQNRPAVNYMTITTVNQKNNRKLLKENKGLADFIICVPENMTKTY